MATDTPTGTDSPASALIALLTRGTKIQAPIGSAERYSLTGVVTADDVIPAKDKSGKETCTKFRLYPHASDPGEYYVFGADALSDTIPEAWTPDQMLHHGPATGVGGGRSIVRVYFRYGAEVVHV